MRGWRWEWWGGGTSCQPARSTKKLPKYSRTFLLESSEIIPSGPRLKVPTQQVVFRFIFPLLFFFFSPSNYIYFSTIEGAHTHLALKFRHTVLTKNHKQQPLHPLPWPGVWVMLEKNLLKAGRKKREFSKKSTQGLRYTEFMQSAPGNNSMSLPSCRGSE